MELNGALMRLSYLANVLKKGMVHLERITRKKKKNDVILVFGPSG